MSGQAQGDFSGSAVGGGRYQLRSLLGEGGMASVHLGHDTVLDRPVAIKTLHSDLGREASFRERFRREAQSVAKLNHTNIVSVFDSGEDEIDGRSIPYIVMELVDGEPLRAVLDRDVAERGAMPAEKALEITGEVLAALAASHEMGLVHRDIKPGNVMLTRRGVVKVMDFGIARALQSGVTSMTQTGMVVGTPQYLSPEQALGRAVDARADLYSVGCMLFELLTGRLPFDGDSPLAVAYQHVQEEAPVPSSVNRSLPPAVDALVARALRKDPAERFPTAEAMRAECRRVAAAGAPPVTPLAITEGPLAHQAYPAAPDAFAVFPSAAPEARQAAPAGAFGDSTPQPFGDPRTPPPYPAPMAFGPPTPPPSVNLPYTPPYQQAPRPTGRPVYSAPAPRRGGNWKPLLIVGAIAVVLAVVLLIVIGYLDNVRSYSGADSYTSDASTPSAAAPSQQIVYGDPTRTVDAGECTTAGDDTGGEAEMPDLTDKFVASVEDCLKAAGWTYRITYRDDQLWGKGTVLSTVPGGYTAFDPREPVTLVVSNGR